jgi:regulator of RNase E activity RraB
VRARSTTEHSDGETPDEFTFEILDILEPLEGEYDGWGSSVQALPKA